MPAAEAPACLPPYTFRTLGLRLVGAVTGTRLACRPGGFALSRLLDLEWSGVARSAPLCPTAPTAAAACCAAARTP